MAVLLAVLAGATVVRLWDVSGGLWIDEIITSWVVSGHVGTLIDRSWINNYSPLYYSLVWLSTTILGFGEVGLRAPSVAAGVAYVAALYWTVRYFGCSRSAALVCAALAAVDPYLVHVSGWARPYSLQLLAALIATVGFFHLVYGTGPKRLAHVAFVGGHVLGLYLQYTMLFYLSWQVLFAGVVWWRGRPALETGPLARDLAVIALALLPAVPHLIHLAAISGAWTFYPTGSVTTVISRYRLDRYVLLPGVVAFAVYWLSRRPGPWLAPETLMRRREVVWFAVFFSTLPVLLVWGMAKVHVVELTQYTGWVAPLPFILLGVFLTAVQGPAARATMALAAAVLVWSADGAPVRSLLTRGDTGGFRQEWKRAVAHIATAGKAGDVVFVDAGLIEDTRLSEESSALLRDYLMAPVKGLYRLDEEKFHLGPMNEKYLPLLPADSVAVSSVGPHGKVWIMAPAGHTGAPATVVARLGRSHRGWRLDSISHYRAVLVASLVRSNP